MVDIEADLFEVEAEEVYFYGVGANLVGDLGVLDAGVELFEILGGEFTTEDTENTEDERN